MRERYKEREKKNEGEIAKEREKKGAEGRG